MSYVIRSIGILQQSSIPTFDAPTNVVAAYNGTKGWVQITWTDNTSDEDNFRMEVDVNGGGYNWLTDPAADATSYNHSPVTGGSTYTYRIRAEKTAENSDWAYSAGETIPF